MKFRIALLLSFTSIYNASSQSIDSIINRANNSNYQNPPIQTIRPLQTNASEICNNNTDDDNNGLTDANDFACYIPSISHSGCNLNFIIWGCSAAGDLYWADMATNTEHLIGNMPQWLTDLSWASDGKLYGLGPSPTSTGIWEIDPHTAAMQFKLTIPAPYLATTAMTADNNDNLYFSATARSAGGTYILKLNLTTWKICLIADLTPYQLTSGGDLTFLNGNLYLACSNNKIATVDIKTGTVQVQSVVNSSTSAYFGLVTCGDGFLYASHNNKIYRIDPTTMVANSSPSFVFSFPGLYTNGLATYPEICQAPKCAARINIDPIDAPPFCPALGIKLQTKEACGDKPDHYTWTTPDGSTVVADRITAMNPGKYYLGYTTPKESCPAVDSFDLQYPATPILIIDTAYRLPDGCYENGTISVTAGCGSGNYKYEWNRGDMTAGISNVGPGDYSVVVTDIDYAIDTTISFHFPKPVSLVHDADIIASDEHCDKKDGSLIATNIQGGPRPYQYSLNDQPYVFDSTFSGLPKGDYSIKIKDDNGCILQTNTTLQHAQGPRELFFTKQDALCGLPGRIMIDSVKSGAPPYSYAFDNSPYSQQLTWTDLPAGDHYLTVKDSYGCILKNALTINQSEQLKIEVTPKDTLICASNNITFQISVLSTDDDVHFFRNNLPISSNSFKDTFYRDANVTVQAINKNGCTATDTSFIAVKYCDSLFSKCLLFPNAFSPNNDGLNDLFGPRVSCDIKDYKLIIYNRWGQIIFQSTDIFYRWNGQLKGYVQNTGIFVYTCRWKDAAGVEHYLKGNLMLVK